MVGIGESVGMREETIKKCCEVTMRAHGSKKQYITETSHRSPEAIFGFAGSWSLDHWFTRPPFGETKISLKTFPSLRSIGNDEVAEANEAFLRRFETILQESSLPKDVEKALKEKKLVVFAGHSSGGPMAILATLWFLEKHTRLNQEQPRCVTFGSPLIGNRIFPHAIRRESWDHYFLHFVMRYDIVPRIMLAPQSSIEQYLLKILGFFDPRSPNFKHESVSAAEASGFFVNVMRNTSSVASHAACNLMGCTNSLLETVSSFIKLSPYRPFGTYVFCSDGGKLINVKNPDAILQMLFYCSQLGPVTNIAEVAYGSLKEHLSYDTKLPRSLEMQTVMYLDNLEELPLSSDGSAENLAMTELGLSTRAKLCLRAAGELEKRKRENQTKIDSKMSSIEEGLDKMQEYRTGCELRNVGYYDSFKRQKDVKDFNANVKRLELAGIWDEIIELLKRYELPDEFECRKKWIDLGTRFRRLVEPLDVANYYRHGKNEDTGAYMIKARPKRYKYTQRWRDHAEKMSVGCSSESCFWAEVEELKASNTKFEGLKERILDLEERIYKWVDEEHLGKDIFLAESTLATWWKTLPNQHKSASCLAYLMCT